MGLADKLSKALSDKNQSAKLETFERSTLRLLLSQMGLPKANIDNLDQELGPAFDFDWFNGISGLDWTVRSSRCFRFNLIETLKTPRKSPLVAHFEEQYEDHADKRLEGFACIMKCHELGRIVLTRGVPVTQTSHGWIEVSEPRVSILLWPAFCANFSGDELAEGITT